MDVYNEYRMDLARALVCIHSLRKMHRHYVYVCCEVGSQNQASLKRQSVGWVDLPVYLRVKFSIASFVAMTVA